MNFHHIDHLDAFAPGLQVGKSIRKGELIGYCGHSGTQSSHCHYEITKEKPARWLQYPSSWTKEKIKELYLDPTPYITATLPMKWNKLGYDFLSPIAGGGWHLGKDLNFNSGEDDFRFPVYATVDGYIEYIGNKATDGGAGNNFWWSEQPLVVPTTSFENMLVQDVQDSGQFALVLDGHRRAISADRAGFASLTVQARGMKYRALTKSEWDSIPEGAEF